MRNIYASQTDRTVNVLLERNKFYFLAPLFDYESSFVEWKSDFYYDPLFINTIKLKQLRKLIMKNSIFNENYEKILEININQLLKLVEDKHKIILPPRIKQYYQEYDELRKKLLKLKLQK